MPGSRGNDAPKHFSNIRRARPSYSCENCRARRVKCDQVHPKCSNCVRNDVQCNYATARPKRKEGPESATSSQSGATEARRPSRRQSDDVNSPQAGHLAIQSGGRSRYIEKTFWASVDSEGLELDSLLSDLPLFPDDDGTARVEDASPLGPASERGPSAFWMSAGSTAHAHPPGVCPRQLNLLRQLPPEQVCDSLYRVFLEGVHPLIPVLCTTSFEASYKRFWNWYDVWDKQSPATDILEENPSFLPLLLAVLFTGSLARTNTDEGQNYLLDAPACSPTALYRMSLTSLTLVAFPQNPGLHSLMAYVLVNSMIIREEEALSSCSFVALAIRVGQAMGLHKDPSQFKSLDPVQSNERRKLWCLLMHLDVMTACVSGLPLVISSEIFSNTKMLSELRDEHVGKRRESESRHNSLEDRYPGYVLAVGRYDASAVMRKILVRQFSPDPLRLVHIRSLADQIEHLKTRVEFRIGRLKAMQTQTSSPGPDSDASWPSQGSFSTDGPSTTALIGWSIDLLQLMVEKAYCILYQPIMSDSEIWADTRSDAIPHYQRYVELFLKMSTIEIYRPFQWLYPQSYQPLHPTAVLLIDSMKQPGSSEMERSQQLIQSIFSLVGPEGRITNGSVNTEHGMTQFRPNTGAKRAWDRLEKLRIRVWSHLGLVQKVDPGEIFGISGYNAVPSIERDYSLYQSTSLLVGTGDVTSVDPGTYPEADVLLFDELQSFSQAWFPPDFYATQDLYGNPSDSSTSQLDLMLPEASGFNWTSGSATEPATGHDHGSYNSGQDQFKF